VAAQTRPGGKILLNLLGPFNRHALLLLDVHDDGHALGRFLRQSGGFMPRRTDPTRVFDYTVPITRPDDPTTTIATTLDPTRLYRRGDWGLLVQAQFPDLISRQVHVDPDPADTETEPPMATELATRDGRSWAQVHHTPGSDGIRTVTQAGPRQLWGEIEMLHRAWNAVDRPERDRWTLDVDSTGATALRLDGYPMRAGWAADRTTADVVDTSGA
jgi:protein-L-isoaspartate(D-aspartate) O-methyltransferase